MSHLTQSEIGALNATALPRKTPFLIQGISMTQFSVARHYGGMTYNGSSYLYLPLSDELIRDDVAKWLSKLRKALSNMPGARLSARDAGNSIREGVKP